MSLSTNPGATSSLPPQSLFAANPLRWLAIFGPGAVIASLTIGVGELVFSARAGALFGYRLLWFFVVILILKWALVFASARHIVLTGALVGTTVTVVTWLGLLWRAGCAGDSTNK